MALLLCDSVLGVFDGLHTSSSVAMLSHVRLHLICLHPQMEAIR